MNSYAIKNLKTTISLACFFDHLYLALIFPSAETARVMATIILMNTKNKYLRDTHYMSPLVSTHTNWAQINSIRCSVEYRYSVPIIRLRHYF